VSQLDDVHSVLRLNSETLRGLISLASPSVAKSTHPLRDKLQSNVSTQSFRFLPAFS
jgi:hypothetical protein